MTIGEVAPGTLLGGRVIYRQLADGYRTGIEPVLLAAFVPARIGERVVEAGTGAGAGLLCLSSRVPELTGLGLEIDKTQATVAAGNFVTNGAMLQARQQDVTLWVPDEVFDHAFANPPWHDARSTPSPDAGKRTAKVAAQGILARWVMALAAALRHRGTLSLILPASSVSDGMTALRDAACKEISVCPLWPHAGAAARLVILRGIRHGAGADRLLPGLVLHEPDGAYTEAADRVLRGGGALG